MKHSLKKIKRACNLAKNKKQQPPLIDKKTILTGAVAIIAIFAISFVADNAIKANWVYEQNPCRLVQCGAVPQVQAKQIGVNEKTGNIICGCPNRKGIDYEVAKMRLY